MKDHNYSSLRQSLENIFGDGLHFEAKTEWASSNSENRKLIRSYLAQLEFLEDFDKDLIENLNQTPPISNLSISHCPDIGAIFYNPNAKFVGVDVEKEDRVKEKILRRVCSENEVNESPNLAALWCAKEASFKAINRCYPKIKVLSQIFIQDWKYIEKGVYSFCVSINSKDSLPNPPQVAQEPILGDHLQHGDQKLNGSGLMFQQNVHFFTFYSQ